MVSLQCLAISVPQVCTHIASNGNLADLVTYWDDLFILLNSLISTKKKRFSFSCSLAFTQCNKSGKDSTNILIKTPELLQEMKKRMANLQGKAVVYDVYLI